MQATAWPLISSFSISSNRRAAGTFSIRIPIRWIGSRVASSIWNPSLAAKRTARSIRTGILAVARLRLADHPQALRAQVLHAVVVVEHLAGGRVVVERVDREVAARGVVVLLAVRVVREHAAVLVGQPVDVHQRAEGGDLDRLLPEHHVHQPEAAADDDGAAEVRLDLLRRGVGGDVEVLRRDVEQQVAHGAADDVRAEAGLLQRFAHPQCRSRHQLRIDVVFGRLDALGLTRPLRLAAREQVLDFRDDAPDHSAARSKSCSVGQPRSRAMAASRASPFRDDRFGHALEQRQVVDRVAVEDRAHARPVEPAPVQPFLDLAHLAGLAGVRPDPAAGELTVGLLGFHASTCSIPNSRAIGVTT